MIIDEGQDFLPSWFVALELCLRDPENGFFYVFADQQQQLYRREWQNPIEEAPFPLQRNCRNTVEICERVNAVLGVTSETLGTRGPAPAFLVAPNDQEIVTQVRGVLNALLNDDEVDPTHVVVLATERRVVDMLRGRELAGWLLGDGADDSILCETVHRFKGLEREVVVLVIPSVPDDEILRLAYVGMSRAMVLLFVVGPAAVQERLSWKS